MTQSVWNRPLFLSCALGAVLAVYSAIGWKEEIKGYFAPEQFEISMVQLEAPHGDLVLPFGEMAPAPENTIAVVELRGTVMDQSAGILYEDTINGNRFFNGALALADDSNVKALVIRLNTGGGDPVSANKIREVIRYFDAVRGNKGNTYVYVDGFSASAGVMIMGAASVIYANPESAVGSIGVIGAECSTPSAENKPSETIKIMSGFGKDPCFNHDGSLNKEAIAIDQTEADESYEAFVQMVAEDRGIVPKDIKAIGAKMMDAFEAKEFGLIDDAIGELALRGVLVNKYGEDAQFVYYQDIPTDSLPWDQS